MWRSAEIDFRRRVPPRDLPEWMDGECSYEEFRGCLRSLGASQSLAAGVSRRWIGWSGYRAG